MFINSSKEYNIYNMILINVNLNLLKNSFSMNKNKLIDCLVIL
jgi:hypothetical protein